MSAGTLVVPHRPVPVARAGAHSTAVSEHRGRYTALDALRGGAVAAMLVVNNPGVRDAAPWPLRHSVWHGLTPADAVFPVFLFAVGASIPMSRRAREPRQMLRRVAVLTVLGLALFALKHGEVGAGFGVLQHIAGAYLVAWLLLRLPRHWPLAATAVVLAAAGAAFVVDGSWAPGATVAHALDTWLVGSWSSEGPTAMVLSSANIVAGAVVGRQLHHATRQHHAPRLLARWAAGSTVAGVLLAIVVPVNKQIWSPSFAVLTHGLACGVMLLLHLAASRHRGAPPVRAFVDLGCNPIVVYVLMQAATYTVLPLVRDALMPGLLHAMAAPVASTMFAVGVATMGWLLARSLSRRRIYIRV